MQDQYNQFGGQGGNWGFAQNRQFTLVTDSTNDYILESYGLKKSGIASTITTMEQFGRLICDHDEVSNFQRERVRIIDQTLASIIKGCELKFDYQSFCYSVDFTFSSSKSSRLTVRRISWPIFNRKEHFDGFHHWHLILKKNESYFLPSKLQLLFENEVCFKGLEQQIIRRIGTSLDRVCPWTPTELDICQYYLEAKEKNRNSGQSKITNEHIAELVNQNKKEGEKPIKVSTVSTHRRNIMYKASQLAHGLDKWERVIEFLKENNIIGI